jgi:hypothetical protein
MTDGAPLYFASSRVWCTPADNSDQSWATKFFSLVRAKIASSSKHQARGVFVIGAAHKRQPRDFGCGFQLGELCIATVKRIALNRPADYYYGSFRSSSSKLWNGGSGMVESSSPPIDMSQQDQNGL